MTETNAPNVGPVGPSMSPMPMHTADLDKIRSWADELGWAVIDTGPLELAKAGRVLRIETNLGGVPNKMTWTGGDEHGHVGSGLTSLNRIRLWMETEWS